MKKKIALILSAVILYGTLFPSVLAANDELVNVAQGKPITSSGFSFGLPATQLVDGSTGSGNGWSSAGDENGIWATVDLGKNYKIDRVYLVTRQDTDQPDARKHIVVEASKDPDFGESITIIETGAEGCDYKETIKAKVEKGDSYRYVRLKQVPAGYTFMTELQVFVKKSDLDYKEPELVTFNDVTDAPTESRLGILSALEIFAPDAEGNFNAAGSVTRAEFLNIVLKSVNMYTDSMGGESSFSDMEGHAEKAAVERALDMGIISAGSARFRPDAPVTSAEAIAMAVRALGYGEYADKNGGYPVGYYFQANNLKLLNGLPEFKGQYITRLEAAYIAYNMLHAVINEKHYDEYMKENSQVIVSRFNIDYDEQICTGNEYIAMTATSANPGENKVVINGKVYEVLFDEFTKYVGRKVRYYYDIDTEKILYLAPAARQSERTVKAADIAKLDGTNYIVYKDGDKTEKLEVNRDAKISYNGRVAVTLTIPADGSVRFIDHESDGAYDTVMITEYNTYVVSRVDPVNMEMDFENGGGIAAGDSKQILRVFNAGKEAKLAAVKKGNVVSVAQSKDGMYTEVYIGNGENTGTITEISADEIVIDYLYRYPMSKQFANKEQLFLGNRGTLLLDSEGKAAAFDEGSLYKYGYLITYAQADGIGGKAEMKIHSEANTEIIYTLSERMKIDDANIRSNVISTLDNLFKENGTVKPQLIKYRANVEMEITEIFSLAGGGVVSQYIDNKWYRNSVFDGQYVVDGDTKVFVLSTKPDGTPKYTVTDRSAFREAKQHTLTGYDNDGIKPFKAVVMTSMDASGMDDETPITMVTGVYQMLTDDGSEGMGIKGYTSGIMREYHVTDDTVIFKIKDYIKKGNLVRLAADSDGMVIEAELILDYAGDAPTDVLASSGINRTDRPRAGGDIWGACFCAYGMLMQEYNGQYQLYTGDYNPLVATGTSRTIPKYDISDNEVTLITPHQLITAEADSDRASYVAVRFHEGVLGDVFVYEE